MRLLEVKLPPNNCADKSQTVFFIRLMRFMLAPQDLQQSDLYSKKLNLIDNYAIVSSRRDSLKSSTQEGASNLIQYRIVATKLTL